ncbi:MAG: Uroporphyrinogen synthase [Mycobacterium sp.]|nr:Uroporphyrinogen synthase [Mycobacterium sp.]
MYRWRPPPRDGDFDQLVAGIAEQKFEVLTALRTGVHATCEPPLLQSRTLRVPGHPLEIRGTCVLVDGVVK